MRKLLSTVLVASVVALAGCGSTVEHTAGNAEPLASVTAKASSEDLAPPEVSFDTPLTATEAGGRVVASGKGEEITKDQNVFINFASYNTKDGELLGDNFDQDPRPFQTTDAAAKDLEVLYDVMVGAHVGDLIAYVEPAQPATPESESDSAEPTEIEELFIFEIVKAEDIAEPSPTLSEDEVQKLEDDGKLPTVEFDDKGVPEITIPKDTEAPEGLAVQVLEEGDGPEAATEDTVTVQYLGVRWEDGETFDASYERGEPATFGLTRVIPGWTKGLEGQKAGSTLLLSIPSDLAYGDHPEGGRPAGPLAFVVEIEDVTKADAAE
ncbi:hypothetical protein BJH93_11570 [Kocuria polaris]|nr:hypothetical protein [Kocuria polaris]